MPARRRHLSPAWTCRAYKVARRRSASTSARSGPGRSNHYSLRDLYRAIREDKPYPVRGLIGFGANILLAHADGAAGREALKQLEFYAHADLFINPTAELADIVLPVASAFEREGLKTGFEISADGAIAGPAAPGDRAAARRGARRYRHNLRPRRSSRARRAVLER